MNTSRLRDCLETWQIPIYLFAIVLALIASSATSSLAFVPFTLEPALAFMLFVTFLPLPMGELRRALHNYRFLSAVLITNFVLVPLLVFALLPVLPADPILLGGALLVLLTPCIDYVVTFAQLGRADSRALLASTPVLLLLQMLLLPVYMELFLSSHNFFSMQWDVFLHAFFYLIILPLLLAMLCQQWAIRSGTGRRLTLVLSLLPVPATALVLFLVVLTAMTQLQQAIDTALAVLPAYILFAIIAPCLALLLAYFWGLSAAQARAVAFSGATRNSLVVLPLGLAIPQLASTVAVVIVTQTLIELLSQLFYIRLMPRFGRT